MLLENYKELNWSEALICSEHIGMEHRSFMVNMLSLLKRMLSIWQKQQTANSRQMMEEGPC